MVRVIGMIFRKIFFFLCAITTSLFAHKVEVRPAYLVGSHTFGEGVGYDSGFSTIQALSFLTFCKKNYWAYTDLKFHFFDDRQIAGNVGVGVRHLLYNSSRIIGLNAYYDFRRSDNDFFFNQIGLGFEILTGCLDFRFNAYIPFDRQKIIDQNIFDQYENGYVIKTKLIEAAYRGFSFEFGGPLCLFNCVFNYPAAGGYFFKDSDAKAVIGGYLRNFVYFKNVFFLEGKISYDTVFETRIQGRVGISIPLGKCYQNCGNCLQYWSTYRNNIIVLDEFCKWKRNY